jgi:hypothetical protein
MSKFIGPDAPKQNIFYGFSRTNDGYLTFAKVDLVGGYNETIVINDLTLRDDEEEQHEFSIGTDYFDGRNSDHELVNASLKYEQYKFREEDLEYFIDDDGVLTVRINGPRYDYPTDL